MGRRHSMDNRDIADVFAAIADLLAVQNESAFKIRAYRTAAETISTYPDELRDIVARGGDLRDISGIGEAIAKKTNELLSTGRLEFFERLKSSSPPGVLDLMEVPGIGPRTAAKLAGELGIASVEQLEAALQRGPLPGLGEARSRTLLKAVSEFRQRTSPQHGMAPG